jgi:peptidyl-dipeptidase A
VGVPEDVAAAAESELARTSRFSKLIFSRWAQVMVRFEKAAYADPTQDLDALWWSLVERYQGLTKPEGRKAPDWATKYHVALAPVYYHNYLLGHAFASQMRHALQDSQTATAADMAAFFKEKVFAPGKRHAWPDLVQLVTGEPLNAAYLAEEMR